MLVDDINRVLTPYVGMLSMLYYLVNNKNYSLIYTKINIYKK